MTDSKTIRNLKTLGNNFKDAFMHPKDIFGVYSPISAILVFVFIISKVISVIIALLFKYNKVPRKGFFPIHFLIFFFVFMFDFYKKCEKDDDKLRIQFSVALKEFSWTAVIIYSLFLITEQIPVTIPIDPLYSTIFINLMKGILLFLKYNWVDNFKQKYGYAQCSAKIHNDPDFEEEEKKRVEKSQGDIRFKGNPYYNDPTTSVIKTQTSIVTSTGDANVIPPQRSSYVSNEDSAQMSKPGNARLTLQ